MGRRRKTRTHVKEDPKDVPKSFVLRSGAVPKHVNTLVKDLRRVMEPNTAIRLKERRSNRLKDFVQVAGQLGVTHTLVLAQKGANVNLRIGRLPRGPTMTFRVTEFAVCKQVLAMQRRPRFPEADFKTSPLVVLNSFSGNQNHIKLMSVMFQNMFPTINVQKLKFNEARRVVLFNYNQEKEQIEMRHYSVAIRQTGVSKGIRNVLQAKLKNIEKYDDLGDFILTGGGVSDSEAEDDPESHVTIPKQNTEKSDKRAIKLTELGPRLNLKLIKIQDGFCAGEVIYHSLIQKTPAQVQELKKRKQAEAELKKKRREEQEANVKRKKEALKQEDEDEDEEEEDFEMDDDFNFENPEESDMEDE